MGLVWWDSTPPFILEHCDNNLSSLSKFHFRQFHVLLENLVCSLQLLCTFIFLFNIYIRIGGSFPYLSKYFIQIKRKETRRRGLQGEFFFSFSLLTLHRHPFIDKSLFVVLKVHYDRYVENLKLQHIKKNGYFIY